MGNVLNNVVGGASFAKLDKETQKKLCDAACGAIQDKTKHDAQQKKLPEHERKQKTYQEFMAQRLSTGPPCYESTVDSKILSEVTTVIPEGGEDLEVLLSNPKDPGKIRYFAGTIFRLPASIKRALNVAKQLLKKTPKQHTTRWDNVILNNATKGCGSSNIENYVEVKFGDDDLTENQQYARRKMNKKDRDRLVEMDPERDCGCHVPPKKG